MMLKDTTAAEEVEIPMHRIKEVRREGKLIWSR